MLIRKLIYLLSILVIYTSCSAQKESTVIIFSKTSGFRHKSIETSIESIKKLGVDNKLVVKATEDANTLISYLNHANTVIFLNTTGDVLNNEQQQKFESYIKNGGGFVGIHAAADTEYEWPWYGKLVGAYFKNHPKQQNATINVVDKNHPATNFLKDTWDKFDEWYNYKNINPDINVLMTLDETSYEGGENGDYHPIAWYHNYDGGRVFFTGLGHTNETYSNETFLKHLIGGINYTIGK